MGLSPIYRILYHFAISRGKAGLNEAQGNFKLIQGLAATGGQTAPPLTGLPWRNRQVGLGLLQCGLLARRRTSDIGGQSGIPSHFSIERRLEP